MMLTNPTSTHHTLTPSAPVNLATPPIAPSGVELDRVVSQPDERCTLAAFAEALTIRDITFECEGDGPSAQHPGFPGAVRQVIGAELMKTASREALGGVSCPWGPACGFHVFFKRKRGVDQIDMPTPWLIQTETTGANSLRITLRLFGLGLNWANEIAEAGHRAIERGIGVSGSGIACSAVLIRSIETVWTGLSDPVPDKKLGLVSFVTPLSLREEQNVTVGQRFLESLIERTVDAARWHGLQISEDWSSIRDVLSQVEMNERGIGDVEWNRSISQQGGANIAMKGQMGLLQLRFGNMAADTLIRLLQIGELLHTGDHIEFGQGRYDLFLEN